jgi:hypothetical protein
MLLKAGAQPVSFEEMAAATTNTGYLSAGDRQPSMTFLDEGGQAMTEDSLGTWLDAMPVDDVRLRIEQIEQELSDLRALERLHEGRQPSAPEPSSGLDMLLKARLPHARRVAFKWAANPGHPAGEL